jgi:hypothetical protein
LSLVFAEKESSTSGSRLKTSHARDQKAANTPTVSDTSLEINTVIDPSIRGRSKASPMLQIQLMRKSRYRKKVLEPINLTKPKMSNNIKDYLSV